MGLFLFLSIIFTKLAVAIKQRMIMNTKEDSPLTKKRLTIEQKVDRLTGVVGTLVSTVSQFDDRLEKLIEMEEERVINGGGQVRRLVSLTSAMENLLVKMEEQLKVNEGKIERLDGVNSRVSRILFEMGDVLAVYRSGSDEFSENMDSIIQIMKERDVLMKEDIQWLHQRMADTESHFWKRDDKWRSLSSDLIKMVAPDNGVTTAPATRDGDGPPQKEPAAGRKRKWDCEVEYGSLDKADCCGERTAAK